MNGHQPTPFKRNLVPAVPAVLGVLFCILNAVGAELLCATSGCAIYDGYQFAGISFYVWGAAGFAVLLFLTLFCDRRAGCRSMLILFLCTALLLDTGFLVWQVLFWPCTSCLAVAVLLFLFAVGLFWSKPYFYTKPVKFILLLWVVAFIPAAVSAGKELLLSPWAAAGPENASISVIFSPTCPACGTTVAEIYSDPLLRKKTAFMPIAKNEEDLNRLALFDQEKNNPDLMQLFTPNAEQVSGADLSLRWRLARNKMILASSGAMSVPLVRAPRLLFPAAENQLSRPDTDDIDSMIFGTTEPEDGCSILPTDPDCD